MGLIEVMVGILTEDDSLDGTKRRVSRPEGCVSDAQKLDGDVDQTHQL